MSPSWLRSSRPSCTAPGCHRGSCRRGCRLPCVHIHCVACIYRRPSTKPLLVSCQVASYAADEEFGDRPQLMRCINIAHELLVSSTKLSQVFNPFINQPSSPSRHNFTTQNHTPILLTQIARVLDLVKSLLKPLFLADCTRVGPGQIDRRVWGSARKLGNQGEGRALPGQAPNLQSHLDFLSPFLPQIPRHFSCAPAPKLLDSQIKSLPCLLFAGALLPPRRARRDNLPPPPPHRGHHRPRGSALHR